WPYGEEPAPIGVYWPPGIPHATKVETFVKAFEGLGYRRCGSRSFEFGYQKVAIYAWDEDSVKHMARQQFWGHGWLSKPGILEDIVHPTLESIESDEPYSGNDYGRVFQVMKRSWLTGILNRGLLRSTWYALRFCWHRIWHYEA